MAVVVVNERVASKDGGGGDSRGRQR
jgi:hypothetical protein